MVEQPRPDSLHNAPESVKSAAKDIKVKGTTPLNREAYKAFDGMTVDDLEDLAEGITIPDRTPFVSELPKKAETPPIPTKTTSLHLPNLRSPSQTEPKQ
ncbi:MAG: hypothetical protein AAB599_02640 [Patescibacteria group bacterium]